MRMRAQLLAVLTLISPGSTALAGSGGGGYRQPSEAVVRLLTATPPPEPLAHAASGRLALLFREPVIELERLAPPFLGLAGFRFDPQTLTSGVEPLVTRVELIAVDAPAGAAPISWTPPDGARLDHVQFSPDGRHLSALLVSRGPARLVLFDVASAQQRELATSVNAAIAISGAYNRTLTPYGFQHEKRSFWEGTQMYTDISPFFHADRVGAPILLVHGDADENPGTPPLQTRRFVNALVGQGVPVRYVGLPFEGHHYWARESVLHAAAELIDWLDQTIGPKAKREIRKE